MLLRNRNALVYGAGGKIGAAVARAFAREGANVFLAGRTLATLEAVAAEITAAGGAVETAEIDALDEQAVEEHASDVAGRAGEHRRLLQRDLARGRPGHAAARDAARGLRPPDQGRHDDPPPDREGGCAADDRAGSGVILTLSASGVRIADPVMGSLR